jgi:hypothetical protein
MKPSFTPIALTIRLVPFALIVSASAIAQTSTDATANKTPAVQTAQSQAALTPA